MTLTPHSLGKLAPLFITRTGKELVSLFNEYGFLDKYDYDNGGLPDIGKRNGHRPSKTEYVEFRLNQLSGKNELRELVNQLINELDDPDTTIPLIDKILKKENYHIAFVDGKYFLQGGVIDNMPAIANSAYFLGIQNQILELLESAKVSIHLAMAWFTNDVLFQKLLEKSKQGVDVKVAIFNDGVNSVHGVDLSKLQHFKIRGRRGGIMHHKFCVIDNQIVITGSYNWSINAETRNTESITVQKDPGEATKFSVEFREITDGHSGPA